MRPSHAAGFYHQRGVMMSEVCSFYRDSKCIATGKSLGFCDFHGFESVCDGDFRFCEKLDAVRKFFQEQKGEEETIPL